MKKKLRFFLPLLLMLIVLPLALFLLTDSMGRRTESEQLSMVERAIRRAAVECYALEGFYPTELSYLTERYGVVVDSARFFVDYQYVASNLMPELTVIPVE